MRNTFDEAPVPEKLIPSIRNTCESFDESDRAFILDERETSLTYFFEENVGKLSANDFYDIFSLQKGEKKTFGGGAQAISTIKRIH